MALPTAGIKGIPSHYTLKYSQVAIEHQVTRIAGEIEQWCREVSDTGDVLVIPILRGGVYFFADLTRRIGCSVEMAPGRARAYEEGKNASARSEVYISLDGVSVSGRHVLFVDDICDSGRTLDKLVAYTLAQGAETVRSAVLIRRTLSTGGFTPDWVGFEFEGSDWFVGYGMDDRSRYSNLSQIYTIKPGK